MKILRTARAQTDIRLDQELGRGGEGTIFGLVGRQDCVVKIYRSPPDDRKIRKLVRMAELASPAVLRIAAWPIDVIIDETGHARGFIMPRVTARRDIHELYSPKSRSIAFSEADFRFLVHVGANIARAFAIVHGEGHVLGDINHGNILVGPDGTVVLIDCDSFQVGSGQYLFTCDVGSALFTPPELQGRSFRGLRRDRNHDLFGLAVILFHLLFMGRHPFAGRYLGSEDMPIERAIAEYRFAYGPDRRLHRMERPPGTPPLESMGQGVARLFVQAFAQSRVANSRPDARAWIHVLDGLKGSLRECASASWHHFPSELGSCPWCRIEQQTGVRLFGMRLIGAGPSGRVDVGTLWSAIEAVPDPGLPPQVPSEKPWSMPPGTELPSGALLRKVLRRIISPGKIAEADKAIHTAKQEWETLLRHWRSQATNNAFISKLHDLNATKVDLESIPNLRRRRLAKIDEQRRADQKDRYLDRFRIDRARIPRIGPTRAAMLASYGIETAADVKQPKILRIPSFGGVLTTTLLEWRKAHEQNFRFNPSEPADPHALAAMEHELAVRQQALVAKLSQGRLELQRISQEITAARELLMPLLEKAWTALKIAEARRHAL